MPSKASKGVAKEILMCEAQWALHCKDQVSIKNNNKYNKDNNNNNSNNNYNHNSDKKPGRLLGGQRMVE